MTVFAPSSYEEVGVMLERGAEHRVGPGRAALAEDPGAPRRRRRGRPRPRARKVRGGGDVCILAVGKMVEAAEEAARCSTARDVHATVWDVRAVPLDLRMLADARRHPLVVTAEDGIAEGGVGSLRAERARRGDGARPRRRSLRSAPRSSTCRTASRPICSPTWARRPRASPPTRRSKTRLEARLR